MEAGKSRVRPALSFATVPAYLVRHAHAGSRSAWTGDDELRPLSDKGRDQVDHLLRCLAGEPIGRVLSSPALRCVQTVEPIAAQVGVEVEIEKALLEGAEADDALALLFELEHVHPVLCSHGDLIPKLVRRLVGLGMATKDANIAQKGSVWVVELDDGAPIRGRYLPPR